MRSLRSLSWTLLLILLVGVFSLWSGCRSLSGYDTDVEIDLAGQESTISCSRDGIPVDGHGFLSPEARAACAAKRDDQRGRAPFWILVGIGVTAYGVMRVRKTLRT